MFFNHPSFFFGQQHSRSVESLQKSTTFSAESAADQSLKSIGPPATDLQQGNSSVARIVSL